MKTILLIITLLLLAACTPDARNYNPVPTYMQPTVVVPGIYYYNPYVPTYQQPVYYQHGQ